MKYYINPQLEKDINTLYTFITPAMRYGRVLNGLSDALAGFGRIIGEYVASTKNFQKAAGDFDAAVRDAE